MFFSRIGQRSDHPFTLLHKNKLKNMYVSVCIKYGEHIFHDIENKKTQKNYFGIKSRE